MIRFLPRLSCPDMLWVPRHATFFSRLAPRAALGFQASGTLGCLGDVTPKLCPSPGPRPLPWWPQPPLFIVSVRSCLLVLSAATLRLKPAKPANSPKRTKCSALLNSLPFPAPHSSPYLLPHSPFLRGGSRNCPKIGQLFIGLRELWGQHKPSVSWWWRDFEQPSPCL